MFNFVLFYESKINMRNLRFDQSFRIEAACTFLK